MALALVCPPAGASPKSRVQGSIDDRVGWYDMQRFRFLTVLAVCATLLASATPAAAVSRIESSTFWGAADGYLGINAGGSATSPSQGYVSRTRDGGYTWRSTRIGTTAGHAPGVVALTAFGSNVWAAASAHRYLWRSADMGVTWSRSAKALPYDTRLTSIQRLSSGRIVLAGSHSATVEADNRPHGRVAMIAATNDDGANWVRAYEGPLYFATGDSDLDPPTEAAIADLANDPSGTTVWALGNEWQRGGSSLTYKQRLVLKSTNAGGAWTPQPGLPKHSPQRMMTSLVAPAVGTIYAFGENRQYLRTSDGGATWNALYLPVLTGAREVNVRAADALDANRILVAGDMKKTVTGPLTGVLAYTGDGGATWTYREFPDLPSLRIAEMLTDTHWFVAGGNEVLLHTTDGGVTWTGQRAPVDPGLTLSSPSRGFGLSTTMPVPLSGTATDTGVGVAAVEVRIRRADGKYWNGVTWSDTQTWLTANSTDGWLTWTYPWTPDAATVASRMAVSITVIATDGCGNRSVSRTVSSAGKTAAVVGVPSGLPSTAVRNRTYVVSGTLSPRHAVGSPAVRIAAQRLQRKSDGTLGWVTRKTVTGVIRSDFRYRAALSLPATGRWRVYAYHPSDAAHITSFSGYRGFTVR